MTTRLASLTAAFLVVLPIALVTLAEAARIFA